eukprot:4789063-Prymnesium_polylepis.1
MHVAATLKVRAPDRHGRNERWRGVSKWSLGSANAASCAVWAPGAREVAGMHRSLLNTSTRSHPYGLVCYIGTIFTVSACGHI